MRLLWLSVLGLAFLCLPIAASDESSQCGKQFVGRWYIHAIASSCDNMMMKFLVKETMTCEVTSTEEGSFTMATNFKTDHGPMDMEMTYTKQEDGLYQNELGDKITDKRKIDDKTYATTNIRDLEGDGKCCKIVSLYSREASVSDSVKQAFIDYATEMQINSEDIFLFTSKGAATKSD